MLMNVLVTVEGVNIIALILLGHTAAAAGVGITFKQMENLAAQGNLVSFYFPCIFTNYWGFKQ